MVRPVRLLVAFAAIALPVSATAQAAPAARSARIGDIRYDVRFDAATAELHALDVTMRFTAGSRRAVLLSFPAWTPGAYEISNFARNVSAFDARGADGVLRWDKVDPDTWRVFPGAAGEVAVSYRFMADTLDPAMSWSRRDFLMLNGTNIFPYPEGQPFDFAATVTVRTEADWRVTTAMGAVPGETHTFSQTSYHDLVDMPLFVGRFDLDSLWNDGRWDRLASYPAGILKDEARGALARQIGAMIRVQSDVFGDTPFDSYTTLLIFDDAAMGGRALGHQNSHVGVYNPRFIGNPVLPLVTGHEIFHAWNGKRLRPAALVPYRYDAGQPTPWLWVSEGISDYYADLTLTRSGIVPPELFLNITNGKLFHVESAPPVALEDASLSVWIHPTDGTDGLHADKGSLAGLLLDILIRDASDNRGSLDSVLRELYASTWMKDQGGFTADDWWSAVSRAAGDHPFDEFRTRYVGGREPLPWATVLPLAGMRLVADTTREPRIGVQTGTDESGVRIMLVQPESMAAEAGIKPGDYLVSVGGVPVDDPSFGARYRLRYATTEAGTPLDVIVRRGDETVTLHAGLRFYERIENSIVFDPEASGKPLRIRESMLLAK
jgi:predicted metalloprotease with PDZ domain